MSREFIGLDLGGSTLKAVAADLQGNVLRQHVVEAGGRIPRGDLLAAMKVAVGSVSRSGGGAPVGLALAGALQPDGTMLPSSTNLPNIAGQPLVSLFESELRCPVRVDNDARAAMRGEAWSGAARHVRNALAISFGTGIGSGIMLDRKIWTGSHGRAGEIGVWKMEIEELGDPWLTFEERAAPSRLHAKYGESFASLFRAGKATELISLTGQALANAHLLLDLEMTVLLGGISELGEPLRKAIESAWRNACQADYQPGFCIRIGEHGSLAGAVGAASLWAVEVH